MKKIISVLIVIMLFSTTIGLIESNANTSEVPAPSFKIAVIAPPTEQSGENAGSGLTVAPEEKKTDTKPNTRRNPKQDSNGKSADNTDLDGIVSAMNGSSTLPSDAGTSSIAKTINDVIGLIQFAGTGISLIVVTMLGIKYMLASPSDKADTKKMIMPILIGCVLLFGAVNIVAAIADLSSVVNG